MRPAIFLDRDGTLIEDVDYLQHADQMRVLPGVPEALRALQSAGYALVIITNQSGVARGLLTEETLAELHQELVYRLGEQGVTVDGIYYCPHHPEHGSAEYRVDCECRKPGTALLEQAGQDIGLDLGASWAVGDKLSDLAGAVRLGCRAVLVRTGYGADHEGLLGSTDFQALVADDLAEAAHLILSAN